MCTSGIITWGSWSFMLLSVGSSSSWFSYDQTNDCWSKRVNLGHIRRVKKTFLGYRPSQPAGITETQRSFKIAQQDSLKWEQSINDTFINKHYYLLSWGPSTDQSSTELSFQTKDEEKLRNVRLDWPGSESQLRAEVTDLIPTVHFICDSPDDLPAGLMCSYLMRRRGSSRRNQPPGLTCENPEMMDSPQVHSSCSYRHVTATESSETSQRVPSWASSRWSGPPPLRASSFQAGWSYLLMSHGLSLVQSAAVRHLGSVLLLCFSKMRV